MDSRITAAIIGAFATIGATIVTITTKSKNSHKNETDNNQVKHAREHKVSLGPDSTVFANNIISGDVNQSTSQNIDRKHKIEIDSGANVTLSGNVVAGNFNNQE